MTTMKEDLADILNRIEVLEQERAAKIRDEAMIHLTVPSGIKREFWEFLPDSALKDARGLAHEIQYQVSQASRKYATPLVKIERVGFGTFWSAVVCATAIGMAVGALLMYLFA